VEKEENRKSEINFRRATQRGEKELTGEKEIQRRERGLGRYSSQGGGAKG